MVSDEDHIVTTSTRALQRTPNVRKCLYITEVRQGNEKHRWVPMHTKYNVKTK